MIKNELNQKLKHLKLLGLMERITLQQSHQAYTDLSEKTQQLETALHSNQIEQENNRRFQTDAFNPELKLLQFYTEYRLQNDRTKLLHSMQQATEVLEDLEFQYKQSHQVEKAFSKASSLVAIRIREFGLEQQDTQNNAVHYLRGNLDRG